MPPLRGGGGGVQKPDDTKDPQEDPPEETFEDHDVSDGEDLDSPEVIEIPE